jgi:hypothetical protein
MNDAVPSALTRVKRMLKRGRYDRATIDAILDAGVLCHVGYALGNQPVVTPTMYWREGDRVYWHGSSASRMLKTIKGGVKACLTVALLDGFVLARSGFHHSINYRSAMIFGKATPVPAADKLASLEAFTERLFPGRWRELRPPTAQELKATLILSMPIATASAKIRTGPPLDDEPDYALPVWAGVLPATMAVGAPIADPRLAPGTAVPAYLKGFSVGGGAR